MNTGGEKKKICIVGRGESIKFFWQSAQEIWGIKEAGIALLEKGYDVKRVYYLDHLDSIINGWEDTTYEQLTSEWKYPNTKLVTLQHTRIPWPHIEFFDILAFIKKYNSDYINNSAAFAICDALMRGYEEIHLHGVDFMPDEHFILVPRAHAKDKARHFGCTMYWIGRAEGQVTFRINPMSRLADQSDMSTRGYRIRGVHGDGLVLSLPTTNQKRYLETRQNIHDVLRKQSLDAYKGVCGPVVFNGERAD